MEDVKTWLTGCVGVGLGAAVSAHSWWVAVVALTVGCGPQIRATLETVNNIVWQWKHPNCDCHTGGAHRPRPPKGLGARADPTLRPDGEDDLEAALTPPSAADVGGHPLPDRGDTGY